MLPCLQGFHFRLPTDTYVVFRLCLLPSHNFSLRYYWPSYVTSPFLEVSPSRVTPGADRLLRRIVFSGESICARGFNFNTYIPTYIIYKKNIYFDFSSYVWIYTFLNLIRLRFSITLRVTMRVYNTKSNRLSLSLSISYKNNFNLPTYPSSTYLNVRNWSNVLGINKFHGAFECACDRIDRTRKNDALFITVRHTFQDCSIETVFRSVEMFTRSIKLIA